MLERVFMLGATGTIGRATVRALRRRGHEVVCMLRPASLGRDDREAPWDGAHIRYGDTGDCLSILHEGMRRERFDTLISCMASRSGAPDDAWAVDYQAHLNALQAL
ncbi:MAG: NAD-dependent epimerase/dehydratase family protein [Burkholderiaceae bacterium]